MAHACIPSIQEAEAEGQFRLHSEFWANLGYSVKCYLKNRTEQDGANLEREHGKDRVGENKEDAPQDGKTLISYLQKTEGSDPT